MNEAIEVVEPVCATCGALIQATVQTKVWLTLEPGGWGYFDNAADGNEVQLFCENDHCGDQLGLSDRGRVELEERALGFMASLSTVMP